ncbi:MAG: ABC transporter ATP-binding protein [Bacteroidetes bacterium]|nr:MAG: ABC transporter ATP-binding protein [Bacteroidota bacterium]
MKLSINGLSKTYSNGTQALKSVTLEIPTGMFGLLGPNGAGKSTLMRIIATLQEADEGSINLNGLDVLKEKKQVRQLLGYLPQTFGLYPDMTAEEMLDHFATLKGIHRAGERKAAVKALLEQTNLYHVRAKKLGTFSGGMKQRFGIAQALLGNPKLIIVDEPTAGLDPSERQRFHNLLSEIGENIIVILSTHIVEDVSDICAHMAIIHEGEVLLTGNPLELIQAANGKVWQAMIEKSEVAQYQQAYNLISSRLYAGKVIVKAYSESRPSEAFQAVAPELEDVYFTHIKEKDLAA